MHYNSRSNVILLFTPRVVNQDEKLQSYCLNTLNNVPDSKVLYVNNSDSLVEPIKYFAPHVRSNRVEITTVYDFLFDFIVVNGWLDHLSPAAIESLKGSDVQQYSDARLVLLDTLCAHAISLISPSTIVPWDTICISNIESLPLSFAEFVASLSSENIEIVMSYDPLLVASKTVEQRERWNRWIKGYQAIHHMLANRGTTKCATALSKIFEYFRIEYQPSFLQTYDAKHNVYCFDNENDEINAISEALNRNPEMRVCLAHDSNLSALEWSFLTRSTVYKPSGDGFIFSRLGMLVYYTIDFMVNYDSASLQSVFESLGFDAQKWRQQSKGLLPESPLDLTYEHLNMPLDKATEKSVRACYYYLVSLSEWIDAKFGHFDLGLWVDTYASHLFLKTEIEALTRSRLFFHELQDVHAAWTKSRTLSSEDNTIITSRQRTASPSASIWFTAYGIDSARVDDIFRSAYIALSNQFTNVTFSGAWARHHPLVRVLSDSQFELRLAS